MSAVVTKGTEPSDYWVTKYKVLYSNDKEKWVPVSDDDGNIIVRLLLFLFKTNSDFFLIIYMSSFNYKVLTNINNPWPLNFKKIIH